MKRRVGRRLSASMVILPSTFALASCGEGLLDPRGPVSRAEAVILIDATAVMLAIIVPVMLLTGLFAWWFRAGNTRARYLPDWEYSGRIEMIVWAIPALVILFLGGVAWVSSHDLDPPRPIASALAPLEVQVVSLDWKWLFIYPNAGIASVNRLVLPSGRPVRFSLTSASVMNSFFVPQLGSQIYTMAGMTTRLNLQADQVGVFPGLSAQFSGEGFSDMRFDVLAESADDFTRWEQTAKASGQKLDATSYAALARPSKADEPMTYGAVETGLFETIASGHLVASLPSKPER
jgi:cytochrome o ubiquinol oxidase subunit II